MFGWLFGAKKTTTQSTFCQPVRRPCNIHAQGRFYPASVRFRNSLVGTRARLSLFTVRLMKPNIRAMWIATHVLAASVLFFGTSCCKQAHLSFFRSSS